MKKIILLIGLLAFFCTANAHHIIGGIMYYEDAGGSGNTHSYRVHLLLYRGCEPVDNNHADLDQTTSFTIYDKDNNLVYGDPVPVQLSTRERLSAVHTDPCIINPPPVCYQVGHYDVTLTLPVNNNGYVVVFQRCCRTNLLLNAEAESNVGATYYTELPGKQTGVIGDNSPVFTKEEAVLICSGSKFDYDYSAFDKDGDSLAYSFVEAYDGASESDAAPGISAPPPYQPLYYIPPYSSKFPMGADVTINPKTGMISGKAPPAGTYVITVSVQEYRNQKYIGETRKDFHIDVTDCHRAVTASIPDNFIRCDSLIIDFVNHSTPGKNYLWDFGDGSFSTQYAPTHAYRDTGSYIVKLKVDTASSCGDSATTLVKAFPILKPNFTSAGSCIHQPSLFNDKSTNTIGKIDSWHWDFGNGDTSNSQNPNYEYATPKNYNVILTVGTSKGCINQDTEKILIYDSPPISVISDTLLCITDSMQLTAQSISPGTFAWTPAYNILNAGSASPILFPRVDTTYQVSFTDLTGCKNKVPVHVGLRAKLIVQAAADTTICIGDLVSLNAGSDGNYKFTWKDDLNNIISYRQDTSVAALRNNTYTIQATLGRCFASDAMKVKAVDAPAAQPLSLVSICYSDNIVIHASGGSSYSWLPADDLSNSDIANPVANPLQSTSYIAAVADTLGCPKIKFDTTLVTVIPPVQAFAGNDTIISTGQIFQLHATGATLYSWTPATGLSDPLIADPIVNGNQDVTYLLIAKTPEGCEGTDSIHVRYIVGPEIYVPTAFTPNNDGRNDVLRPIPVGIKQLDYFRVFDRWGQLIFQTKDYLAGWNGILKGAAAAAGSYVWMAQGTDFTGKVIARKGVAILIR